MIDDDKNDEEDIYIYRGGSATAVNFTPAVKDAKPESDKKSGLSFFDSPEAATQGKGGPYQIVSLKALKKAGFKVEKVGGHYGVRPMSQTF